MSAAIVRSLPAPITILSIAIAAVFGIITAARGLVDVDYYFHVVAGELIARTGDVPTTDPFSFTYGGPWTMHEWLGELVIFWLVETIGVGPATFLFGVVGIAGPLLVARSLVRSGLPTLAVGPPLILVAYVFTSYVAIRPQAISWLLLGILLATLIGLRPDHRWRPWLIPLLFVLWANVHGLYVIGLGVLGIYVLFTVLGRTLLAPRRGEMVGVLLAAFLGSALTPHGPAGLLYPLRYIDTGDWGLRHIAEWRSPDFHEPMHIGLLLLIGATVLVGTRTARSWLGVSAALAVIGALLATRNAPLAAMLCLAPLAHGLAERVRVSEPRPDAVPRRLVEAGAAAIVVAAAALILPGLPMVAGASMLPRYFPVAAVERLEVEMPDARVLAEYGWGGYVIHELYWDGGRVFVDGRNDMYPDEILEDFVVLRNAEPGWEQVLEEHRIEAVLLPPGAELVNQLGWCEAHRDQVAVLLFPTC